MKNILKFILLTTMLLAIQGCATHAKFVKKYDAWVGQDISSLINKIGAKAGFRVAI